MDGTYVYCRLWVGFTGSFPWFDELNSLPDVELVNELNRRTALWFGENKSTLRERYRSEQKRLKNAVERMKRRSIPCRPIPRMGIDQQLNLAKALGSLNHRHLVELATQYGVQLAGTDRDLCIRLQEAMEEEHEYNEINRRSAQYRQRLRDAANTRFSIARYMRGERKNHSFETRVARAAGWLVQDARRFGGLSPTSKLMLRRFAGESDANEVIRMSRDHFVGPDWDHLQPRFGTMPCAGMSKADVAMLELRKSELLQSDSRWAGTPMYSALLAAFTRICDHFGRVDNQAPTLDSGQSLGAHGRQPKKRSGGRRKNPIIAERDAALVAAYRADPSRGYAEIAEEVAPEFIDVECGYDQARKAIKAAEAAGKKGQSQLIPVKSKR